MGVSMYDPFKDKCVGTQLKFTFLPKTCYITGRTLLFEYVYKQTAMWTNNEIVFEHRYYDKNEFLIAKLKGEV